MVVRYMHDLRGNNNSDVYPFQTCELTCKCAGPVVVLDLEVPTAPVDLADPADLVVDRENLVGQAAVLADQGVVVVEEDQEDRQEGPEYGRSS